MMQKPKIGEPVLRREDQRLITGAGAYSDDFNLPGQAYGYVVRSPHPHARITSMNVSRAAVAPDVVAILTAKEMQADGLNPAPHRPRLTDAPDVVMTALPGGEAVLTPYLPLPLEKVRYVGEGIVFVIAETLDAARNAGELIDVAYELLPANTLTADAEAAENIWANAPGNLCVDAEVGDVAATQAAFASAAHIITLDTWLQRVTGLPLEPRAAVAKYDSRTQRYTLYAGSGGTNRQKGELARILNVEESVIRVVARDIGGNFGTRNAIYPEFALCAWAARRTGRPVKWTCERTEAFATDYQGRDMTAKAELALDSHGKILAFRSINTGNIGAHTVSLVSLIKSAGIMTSIYDVPAAHVRARAVLTNTVPTNSYRGAGRPEAIFVIERLLDIAARRTGLDRIDIRHRNLIDSSGAFYANPLTLTYDGGNYRGCFDKALDMGKAAGFEKRRKKAAKTGRLRGIGFANYIEITTGVMRERTEITVHPDGHVDYTVGTLSSGQGHETSFAQLLTDWLGVPLESINFIQGDTDRVEFGGGTQSGRSMRIIGIVVAKATDDILARARRIAAHVFEQPAESLRFEDGRFFSAGNSNGLDLFDLARAAIAKNDLPDDLRGPLTGICDDTIKEAGYPYGAHVCEVEVDPDTGEYEIIRYSAVDDVGTCVNPMIMHGQTHGAITQGLGQAMSELCAYEPAGQLIAGSFMDYAIPRADNVPSFDVHISEFPSPTNRLGVRSGGEGGTVPSPAALINALCDALKDYGVEHIEMPATAFRVWQAIQDSRSKSQTQHKGSMK